MSQAESNVPLAVFTGQGFILNPIANLPRCFADFQVLPIVSIVVPFFGLTKYIIRIL